MTRRTLLVPLALAAISATLAFIPAAAALDAAPAAADADAYCIGKTEVVAMCTHYHNWYECYHFWILGQERPEMEFC